MRKIFILLSFVSLNVSAQDVIVKKDGSTILSKVIEVNQKDIRYKKHSNQNGPTYTIDKSEIMTINYENGEKDDFASDKGQNDAQSFSQVMINKPADANNDKIIERHNVVHPNLNGKPPKNKACTSCTIKYGIKTSSIMSNEDIEMEFVRKLFTDYYYNDALYYYINITNKTDRVLYIDKGNCFKIYNDGYSYCYYDASIQTTVNNGGSSGGSVNIGSLAGALGIGGTIGQIAGGVNVGGSSSSSVSTTYASQRFIAIPPHGSKFLTEMIIVGEGKRRKVVETPESFFFWSGGSSHECKSTVDVGLKRGVVNRNETKVFGENELPWKREYYITYSTDDNFSSYSVLHAELYIQEIIGEFAWGETLRKIHQALHKKGEWFLNENTIVSGYDLDKK